MMLAASDWVAIANLATPIVCGGVGWLIKRVLDDQKRRITAVEAQNREERARNASYVEEHRKEHRTLEGDVVGKEDWLRESGLARQRQEKIIEDLSVLKGRQDAGIEIASAIAAALNRRDANG